MKPMEQTPATLCHLNGDRMEKGNRNIQRQCESNLERVDMYIWQDKPYDQNPKGFCGAEATC
jgi:hypothetical protein